MKKLLLVFFVLLVGKGLAQIYAPEGLNMPGAWNGWTNPPTNALALACSAQTSGGLLTVLTDDQRRYHTTFQSGSGGVGSGTNEWLFTSGPSGSPWNNKWGGVTVSLNTIQTYTFGGANNSATITSGKYYTLNWKDNGYGNTEAIFMETSGNPVSISSVVDNNQGAGVNDTVTVTLSGTPSTEEKVYLRYTTDSWSTHKFVLATGSGTTWKAVIPAANVSSSMVGSYKGLTSTVTLADTMKAYRVALYTLYSKDGAPITAITAGNWSSASTWNIGRVPSDGASVIIDANVTIDQDVNVLNLTINSGKTLTASSTKTLTIASGGVITNNGTFTHGSGTVVFAGLGTVTGTVGFNNVTMNGGVNYGSASTINGTMTLNSGAWVEANSPIYASGSTLKYNTGGTYGRWLEWKDTTGAGYPSNVVISASTTVDLYNSDTTVARRISGNLTIDASSGISLVNKAATLTVNGDIVNNGTITLSDQSGGDLIVKGNFTNNGTFTANDRAISFKGSSQQTVGGTTAPLNFAYVIFNNAAGIVLAQNVVASKTTWLTAGKVSLGSYNYVIGDTIIGTFSTSAMMSTMSTGQVKKIYTGKTSFLFPVGCITRYTPVTITNNGTFTADTIGVAVTNTKHSANNNATDYLNRYWTLSGAGASVNNYTAVFQYTLSDIFGTEANYVGARYNGSAWTALTAVNTTAHTFTATAQSSYGVFTAGAASGFSSAGHIAAKVIPQGFYNAGGYLNASDTVLVLLANVASPNAIVDSAYAILDSLTFTATATMSAANSGTYYVVVKHRNSIETWSASGVAYTKGSTTSYDFTTAATQAYGSNEVEVATGVYGIYGGDCNQDGYVDPLDLSMVDQDSFNYVSGRAGVTDVNGDGFVDPLDLSIVDQNSFNYVGVKLPASGRFAAKSKAPQGIHFNEFKATQVK